jgi:hypothetical protein
MASSSFYPVPLFVISCGYSLPSGPYPEELGLPLLFNNYDDPAEALSRFCFL